MRSIAGRDVAFHPSPYPFQRRASIDNPAPLPYVVGVRRVNMNKPLTSFAQSETTQLIQVTDRARQELLKLEATGENFLRISVISGGCSGMTYNACIDNTLSDADQVIFQDGEFRVVADAGSTMFLDGLQIDFSDDLIASGFRFKNPKAKKACGCGSSFGM